MSLLDFLFPRRCVGCGSEGSWICHACREWSREGWPRLVSEHVVALAPFQERVVREAIHSLKYHGTHEVAGELVNMLWSKELQRLLPDSPVLVPVPTSFARRKVRGYNQAELIAREVGRLIGAPVRTDLLIKTAKGSMVGKGRSERLASAGYALRKGAHVPSEAIVLIDDLRTSGSTIAACQRCFSEIVFTVVLAQD